MTALPLDDPGAAVDRLQAYLERSIPLVKVMGVEVVSLDENALVMRAPLEPNRNHIGTAFGGSLHGLATLASWGLLWLLLEHRPDIDLVVRDSRMQYTGPGEADLEAACPVPNTGLLTQFLRNVDRRGKAAIELSAQVRSNGRVCADFEGRFVAIRSRRD
jgi:thioesterase domain-containing protein